MIRRDLSNKNIELRTGSPDLSPYQIRVIMQIRETFNELLTELNNKNYQSERLLLNELVKLICRFLYRTVCSALEQCMEPFIWNVSSHQLKSIQELGFSTY
jgi:hypothetical protein